MKEIYVMCGRMVKVRAAASVLAACLLGANASGLQFTISTVAGGAPPRSSVQATEADISGPSAVVIEPSGTVAFSTADNCIFGVSNGLLVRLVGNCRRGFSGDGEAAENAMTNKVGRPAVDSSGNLYFPDIGNDRIRKVSPDGVISTIAGGGVSTSVFGTVPATAARLDSPSSVAVDEAGSLYIVENGGRRVRKVFRDGSMIVIAGRDGLTGFDGDGGPAITATFSSVQGIAVDSKGNIYLADSVNQRVRVILKSGNIQTFAGTGQNISNGDGGPATFASLDTPVDVYVDAQDNLLIATQYSVRSVSSSGVISTIAGNGIGYIVGVNRTGDGVPALDSVIYPSGIASDAKGIVYIADSRQMRVYKVDSDGILRTVAGSGRSGYGGDGGQATLTHLGQPNVIASALDGTIYFSDINNKPQLRKMTPDGFLTTVAGNLSSTEFQNDVPALTTLLPYPSSLAIDSEGSIYVGTNMFPAIYKINANGVIKRIAGTGLPGFSGDGGAGLLAQLRMVNGITLDAVGNIYFSDFANIRRISTDGIITTVGGTGVVGSSQTPGPALGTPISPGSLVMDSAGSLYFCESAFARVRVLRPDGMIYTVAGNGSIGFSGDEGPAIAARVSTPFSIVQNSSGTLYIATDFGTRIRSVTVDGVIHTVAGTGVNGYTGDGGPAINAQIGTVDGLAIGPKGGIFLSDSENLAIRHLQPSYLFPQLKAVTNAASNLVGPIAPGEIVTIYGLNLGPAKLSLNRPDYRNRLGPRLGGLEIIVNGLSAPIVYSSELQVSALIPYSIVGDTAQVVATRLGVSSQPFQVRVAPAQPEFFVGSANSGNAAAINQDGTLNTQSNAAALGSVVSLFATGSGQLSPIPADGEISTSPLAQSSFPVSVSIGGQPANVLYAGSAPGTVTGVLQINARIPLGTIPSTAVPVQVNIAGQGSRNTVTLSIISTP